MKKIVIVVSFFFLKPQLDTNLFNGGAGGENDWKDKEKVGKRDYVLLFNLPGHNKWALEDKE